MAETGSFRNLLDEISTLNTLVEGLRGISKEAREDLASVVTILRAKAIQYNESIKTDWKEHEEKFKELAEQFNRLKARFNALREPPNSTATFVRFIRFMDLESGEEVSLEKKDENKNVIPVVEVKNPDGKYQRVFFVVPNVDPQTLKYGEQVIVSARGHVIEATHEFPLGNVTAVVDHLLDPDHEGERIIAETGHNTRVLLHPIDSIDIQKLKKGTPILVDPATGLIVDVLPEHESSEYAYLETPDVTFADIGGLRKLKEEIMQGLIWPLVHGDVYETLGLNYPKGFVLEGPPGCGKTLVGKAISNLLGASMQEQLKKLGKEDEEVRGYFLYVPGASLFRSYVGEGEKLIRDEIFGYARKKVSAKSPFVIFIDEPDSTLRTRQTGISTDASDSLVNQFCTEMDGLKKLDYITVIIATNRYDMLDPAVTREGRFDARFTVPAPDKDAATEIFHLYLKPVWGQIHPKYDKDVYVPRDKEGKPKRDPETGGMLRFAFRRDPQKVADYLITKSVERMYDKGNPKNRFLKITFVDGTTHEFYRGDFCSGARIKNIIDTAKKMAGRRHLLSERKEPLGVMLGDLYQAIEEVFARLKSPSESTRLEQWLRTQGHDRVQPIKHPEFFQDDILEEAID